MPKTFVLTDSEGNELTGVVVGEETVFTANANTGGVVTNGKITFKHKSTATNPTADVESTLVLTMTDAFGHENVYKLPFTVKRAE